MDRVTLSSLNSSTGAPCTGRLSPRRTAPARTTRPTHAAVARPETVAYELALLLLADNPPTGTSVATTRDARSLSSTRATVLRGHPAPPYSSPALLAHVSQHMRRTVHVRAWQHRAVAELLLLSSLCTLSPDSLRTRGCHSHSRSAKTSSKHPNSVWCFTINVDAAPQHCGSKPVFLLAPNIGAKQAGVDPFSHIFGARSPFFMCIWWCS